MKKICGFYEYSWPLCKNNHSKTLVFYVTFCTEKMVTGSIQNWKELNYVVLKVHQTTPAISSTCAWENALPCTWTATSASIDNLFSLFIFNINNIIIGLIWPYLVYYFYHFFCSVLLCSSVRLTANLEEQIINADHKDVQWNPYLPAPAIHHCYDDRSENTWFFFSFI